MTISVRAEKKDWLVSLCKGSNPERERFEFLTREHWNDVAVDKDVHKLAVKWSFYEEMFRLDRMMMIVVRDDGVLVGYFIYMISPTPHYEQVKQATEDSHFILPEYRKRGYGKAMVACAEQDAIVRGATVMKVRTKIHRDNSEFWEGRGFKRIEYVYQKVLRRN